MITQSHEEVELGSSTKQNLDPLAVLKRVEELRKWQEDEKMKLLQAHEDQMQQFRIEQVNHQLKVKLIIQLLNYL